MEERRAMSEGEGLGERLLSISLSSAVFTPFTGPQVIDRQTKEKQAESNPLWEHQ